MVERGFEILAVVLPVVAALGLGWLARVKKLVAPAGIAGLKALVMNFCLPAVLLGAFYTTRPGFGTAVVAGAMVACCAAGLGLGFAAGRVLGFKSKLLPFLTTGFEAGMMGYGLYAMLFGAGNVGPFAMVDLGQVVFVFTLYMALLNRQKGIGGRQTLLEMVRSPVFLAIVAGVALGASGLGGRLQAGPAGPAVDALLNYISAPTGMLMLFVVGYGLKWERAAARAALATAAIRAVVMAALCAACLCLVGLAVPVEGALFWAVVLMFTLPPPFVLPVFSNDVNEEAYVSTTLSLCSVLSIAAFGVISLLV